MDQPVEQPLQLEIKGEFIFYGGKEIAYEKQMIKQDSFFLVEEGVELPLTQEILDFDEKYFWYMLNKKIIRELELLDASVGLQILEAMPDLPEKSYVAIFGRLSLHKIKKVIMNNQFYLHLIKKLHQFGGCQRQSLSQCIQLPQFADLCNLDQPHKRLLYILDYVSTSQPLRQVFYLIALQVVFQIVNSQALMDRLSQRNEVNRQVVDEESEEKKQIGRDFLKNALKMMRTLFSMSKMPQELLAEYTLRSEREVIKIVLKPQFIETITVNFEYFCDYDPKNLTELLSIIAIEKEEQLWSDIIAKKYAKPNKAFTRQHAIQTKTTQQTDQKQKNVQFIETTNEYLCIKLMVNNFYEIGQPQWEISEGLIQGIIKHSGFAAKFWLIKLFSQLTSHFTTVSVIELVVMFLRKVCLPPQFDRTQIQFFLIEFLGNINVAVSEQYGHFQAKQKEDLILIVALLKVYNLILELKLVNLLCGLSLARSIRELMELTRGKKGLVEGARRAFLKTKKIYLLETHLQQILPKKSGKTAASTKNSKAQKTISEMQELAALLKQLH